MGALKNVLTRNIGARIPVIIFLANISDEVSECRFIRRARARVIIREFFFLRFVSKRTEKLVHYCEIINTSSSMSVTAEIIYDAKSRVFNF